MPLLPEPTWDESQQVEVNTSSMCATDTRPSIITGAIMSLLRDHFSRSGNITNEKLRNLIWKPKSDQEDEQSMIHIEPWHMYDADHLQQRPAAYVSRGQVSVQRIALKDKSLTHISRRSGMQEGKNLFKLLSFRHQVICCSAKSDMAADRLAEEIFYMLLEYGPSIQEDLKLGGFHVTAITPSQEIDDDHENFMVGVQILCTNLHSWKLKPLSPILKNVAFVVNET
jgi:hypothetical protein